jgi:hypothetical protein
VIKPLLEKDLQLVVSEKTLGSLTTNAKAIRETVANGLQIFHIDNYDDSNIDIAKKDKALLNNAGKILNSERIKLEKEFMQPFNEFKDIVNDTVKIIAECSSQIDNVVKEFENKEKQKKYDTIETYFLEKNFILIEFEKIFDSRWLNKTVKLKEVYSCIDARIKRIDDELATLEAIGEDVELLKSMYLDNLNINATIQYANTLKQNRERARIAAVTADDDGNSKTAVTADNYPLCAGDGETVGAVAPAPKP